jgi:hypothetical protein
MVRNSTIDGSEHSINGAKHSIDGSEHSINGAKRTIDGSEHSINGAKHTIDGSEHSIDGPKHTIDASKSNFETPATDEKDVSSGGSPLAGGSSRRNVTERTGFTRRRGERLTPPRLRGSAAPRELL